MLTLGVLGIYFAGNHLVVVERSLKTILLKLLPVEGPQLVRFVGERHARGPCVGFDEDSRGPSGA